MRIRSIKPEFWRSEDIASFDRDTRLLFIGLWSYVDDNGVGRDVEALIVADLFALDDPSESLAMVSRGLRTLSERGLIARYEAGGKRFLAIRKWEHQKIDHPNKDRYPGPPTCENEQFATSSRDTRETLAPGAVEQWNRGTGDIAVVELSSETKVSNAREENGHENGYEPPPLQEQSRSAPVNISVAKIINAYAAKVRPCDRGKIGMLITNATADWTIDAISQAVDNLAADRRSVTADSLRIELDGLELPDKNGVIHFRNGGTKEIATGILRTKSGKIVGGGGPGTGRTLWRDS